MITVKIGLIGCGAVTIKAHIPALMNNPSARISSYCYQVSAISSLDEENISYIQSILPGVAVYRDYRDLLDRADCGAVLIATGQDVHPMICAHALRKGKYILCEKPLGTSTTAIKQELGGLAQVEKNRLQIAFNKRFHPVFLTFKKLALENKFGIPECGSFYFVTQQGKKSGIEGILSNLIHYCDLVCAIFGIITEVKAVYHSSANGISLAVAMQNDRGSIVSLLFNTTASWSASLHEEWQIIDEERNRFIGRNCDEACFFGNSGHNEAYSTTNSIFWEQDPHGYKTQLQSFYDLVCQIRNQPEVSIDDALQAHNLYERIMIAAGLLG